MDVNSNLSTSNNMDKCPSRPKERTEDVVNDILKEIPEKITSVEQLFGTIPNDIDLDDVRTERLSK